MEKKNSYLLLRNDSELKEYIEKKHLTFVFISSYLLKFFYFSDC